MQVNQIYAILNDIMLEISGQVVPIYNEQADQRRSRRPGRSQ